MVPQDARLDCLPPEADEVALEAVNWLDGGADTGTDDVLLCEELL